MKIKIKLCYLSIISWILICSSHLAFSSERSDWGTAYQIVPELLISGHSVADNLEQLRYLGVTHILNVTSNNPPLPKILKNFNVLRLELEDEPTEDLTDSFDLAYKFISDAIKENERAKVLVHCSAGQSRSASMLLYYLMRTRSLSLQDALTFSRSIKPNISPNYGFMKQLIQQEQIMRGETTVDIEKYMISQVKDVFSWIDDDIILSALEESSWNVQLAAQQLLDY
ncbi:MAG: dual specificity protein phosphatase family protein [Oligoflexales bacterium]